MKGFKGMKSEPNYTLFSKIKEATIVASKSGKLKGYCKDCGLMLIGEDVSCPKCGCKKVVKDKPNQRLINVTNNIYILAFNERTYLHGV